MRIGYARLLAPLLICLVSTNAAVAQQAAQTPRLTLSSPSFKDMEPFPLRFTQTGTGVSSIVVPDGMNNAAVNPAIQWDNVPQGTNAFVLMLSDNSDIMMWVVVNIPGSVRSLPEGIPNGNNSAKLPAGAWHRSYRTNGWIGPGASRTQASARLPYIWKLYPLDEKLEIPRNSNRAEILRAMEGHLTGNKAVMIITCCDESK